MEDLYSKMGLKLVKRVPVHSNYERLKTKAAAEKKRLEHQIKVLRAKVRTTERVAKEHRERTSARSKRDKGVDNKAWRQKKRDIASLSTWLEERLDETGCKWYDADQVYDGKMGLDGKATGVGTEDLVEAFDNKTDALNALNDTIATMKTLSSDLTAMVSKTEKWKEGLEADL